MILTIHMSLAIAAVSLAVTSCETRSIVPQVTDSLPDTVVTISSRPEKALSERDLIGEWEGYWASDSAGKRIWTLDVTCRADSGSRSSFSFDTGSDTGLDPSASYHVGNIDSIGIHVDTVRLYCRVRRVDKYGDTSMAFRELKDNFPIVYTGIFREDTATGIKLLTGTVEASGRRGVSRAVVPRERTRFMLMLFQRRDRRETIAH